jgi:hypothetical protein
MIHETAENTRSLHFRGDMKLSRSRMTDQELKEFRSIREEAGQHIDPATAEVDWEYGQPADPYRINPDLPEECRQVGRLYFARAPGSDIWVSFYDLPEATLTALWERHGRELVFPAGLPLLWESH